MMIITLQPDHDAIMMKLMTARQTAHINSEAIFV
jgi:hypothetical protein